MSFGLRRLPAAALGVTLVTFGAVLSQAASAASAASPAASLSLSSPAARAHGVSYTVKFTPSAALAAGKSTLTLTAPKGTVLPTVIADVFDVTANQDLGGVSGGKLAAAGAKATWTVSAAIPAGDVIDLTLAGVTNPAAGTYSLGIATSEQKGVLPTAPYHVSTPRAVRSPLVPFADQEFFLESDQTYPVQFTTSPSGALAAGHGTITLTAAKGTILPLVIGDLYDVTTGADLGPLPGGVLSASGAAGTWRVAATIPAGHVIDLRLDGVTNPKAGRYELGIATSSDTVVAKAPYTIVDFSNLSINGGVLDPEGDNYTGATVEACSSAACFTTGTDSKGNFFFWGLPAGQYTVAAYPRPSDAGSVSPETQGPVDVTSTGSAATAIFDLQALNPVPAGAAFAGQSGTVPAVYWDSAAPLSMPGCKSGAGVAVVSAVDPATGTPDVELGRLTENPAGSGTYTATVPPLYPAHGAVTVGTRTACSPPTALLPGSGPAGGGNEVQLTGQGFTGAIAVMFGGKHAKSFIVASDTQIDAVAPAGSGTVGVSVVTPHATIASASLAEYTYLSMAVHPASGPAAGGQTVTLTGSGLSGVEAVYFGSRPASKVDAVSDTEITAVVPAGTPGRTVPVTILTADGGQTSPAAVTFTYWAPPGVKTAPADGGATAVAASPAMGSGGLSASAAGPAGPAGAFTAVGPLADQLGVAGDIVKIMASSCHPAGSGTAFATALNGALARVAGDLARPQGWAGVAGGLTGGAAALLSTELQSPLFSIFQAQPLISGGSTVPELIASATLVAAYNVLARHGARPSVLRADLNCATSVLYPAPSPVPPATTFSARALPAGTVLDTNGHPVAGATVTLLRAPDLAQPFSPLAPGSVGMEPSVNPRTSDSNGAFGWDLPGGRYEVTAQKAGCTMPGHPGQPVVTSPVFQGLLPKAGLVLMLSCPGEAPPSAPAVAGLSTDSGAAVGGAQVDVAGSGFTGSPTVTFGTRNAAAVTVLSPTELAATAPAGTGTVDVRVRTAHGTSAVSAPDRYTYVAAPAVTKIAPKAGPAKGGTVVTITGSGFAPGDQVTFGSSLAQVVSVASATRIVAVTPQGLGPAGVTVLSADGSSRPVAADVFTFLLKPAFTSAASVTAVKGKAFRFTVRTTAYPVAVLSGSGKLPGGLRITIGKGTAVISGKPTAAGRFTLHLTARNSLGTAKQTLTITVKT